MITILTIDEKIARSEHFAKLCEQAEIPEWQEECEQLAEWLRELVERRKAPEIVRCGECKHASTDATCCLVCNREGMGLRPYHVHSDDYCSYAERRTE